MNLNRRNFLAGAGLVGAGLAWPTATVPAAPELDSRPRVKLGIASYSYWHFRPTKVPIETVIDQAAALGVEGVDILHRQMESEEGAYLHKLKRHAFLNGMDLICLSIHQDFVDPDPAKREKEIAHTIKCIELAAEMGIPCIRLNSGRWNTIQSFDDLMAARGVEPILPGYTLEDGFNGASNALKSACPKPRPTA
jgi:L-ribulose-5-phosphate 3-epimerase